MKHVSYKIFLVSLLTFQILYPADENKSAKPFKLKLRPSSYLVPEQHKDNPWATGIIDSAAAIGALFAVATGFVHKDQIQSVLPDVSGLWRSARSSVSGVASKVSLPKIPVSSSAIKQGAVCTSATCAGGFAGWFLRGSQSQPEVTPQIVQIPDTQTVEGIMGQLRLTDQERDEELRLMVTNFPQAREKCVGFVHTLVAKLHENHATISQLEEQKNEFAYQKDHEHAAREKAENALALLAMHIGKKAGLNSDQVDSEIHPDDDPDKVAEHRIRYMGVLLKNHETERCRLVRAYDELTTQHAGCEQRLHKVVEEKSAIDCELARQRRHAEIATSGLKGLAKRVARIVIPKDSFSDVCDRIEGATDCKEVSHEAQDSLGLIERFLIEADCAAGQGFVAQGVLDEELLRGLPKKGKEQYLRNLVVRSQADRKAIASRSASEIMAPAFGAGVASGSRVELK